MFAVVGFSFAKKKKEKDIIIEASIHTAMHLLHKQETTAVQWQLQYSPGIVYSLEGRDARGQSNVGVGTLK